MPAGNPVINTSSIFPSPAVGGPLGPHSATAGTLVANLRAHEEDHGGADQRTAAGDSEAQTRATTGAAGSAGTQAAAVHDHRLRSGGSRGCRRCGGLLHDPQRL